MAFNRHHLLVLTRFDIKELYDPSPSRYTRPQQSITIHPDRYSVYIMESGSERAKDQQPVDGIEPGTISYL